jgi:nitric oxide reductase NorQ protein
VRCGGICYLDEIVEDVNTTVVIHPLADDRRMPPMERHGELPHAPPEFLLAMLPTGYQSVMKSQASAPVRCDQFDFPVALLSVIITETGLDPDAADKLIRLAEMTRNLKGNGLDEGASTRLLVHAGKLIAKGIPPRAACNGAIAEALTDDAEMRRAIHELATSLF